MEKTKNLKEILVDEYTETIQKAMKHDHSLDIDCNVTNIEFPHSENYLKKGEILITLHLSPHDQVQNLES